MKKRLKLLLELQTCDNRIHQIIRKKAEGPLRMKGLRGELEEIDQQNKDALDRLEVLKKERRKFESEVQELVGKIEKSGLKLSNVKSNKEYAAALKEIEDLKSMQFAVEDKILKFMEDIDTLEKDLRDRKKKREETAAETEKMTRVVQEEMKELDRRLEALQGERPQLVEKVEKSLLKTYSLLMERKGGQAVAAVVRGVCQACHIGLPPQDFNNLLKGDAILTCPHCNRLIYWGEDQEFTEQKQE
ncbi:MAG: hypothetical protein C4576_29465 [Desulfobacteraceae bacterium]|nr:MAG: hypothetical protein C4576_29465 [Desulfobacteraceae bacterium]